MSVSECDVTIVGAGVIGLAIAAKLPPTLSCILVESHSKFGQETSSRNSEVIHSGIYYPLGSQKTQLCIRGRELLYSYLQDYSVEHKKCGKYVVATENTDFGYLEKLKTHCESLGVPCKFQKVDEPEVIVKEALLFPETGIVDSHQLMLSFERIFLDKGGIIAYQQEVQKIQKEPNRWIVTLKDSTIKTKWVINAAGLFAAELSNQALMTEKYEHRFCRGRYFSLGHSYKNKFQHLIYPVPVKDGLGVHVTIDTEGNARLGPDVEWCETSDYEERQRWYDCDWESLRESFAHAVQQYCPSIKPSDLTPGLIGIRPKLFIEGRAYPDFVVEDHGGYIHCLGIESPGLTSCLSIAERVCNLMEIGQR